MRPMCAVVNGAQNLPFAHLLVKSAIAQVDHGALHAMGHVVKICEVVRQVFDERELCGLRHGARVGSGGDAYLKARPDLLVLVVKMDPRELAPGTAELFKVVRQRNAWQFLGEVGCVLLAVDR